ncbi:MAG: SpoIIE family protein phosphatase [Gammaproteobacteria bacterium]|nr:SpoIIE family protein phosphatase [Gammaproteobacteria bacterium]
MPQNHNQRTLDQMSAPPLPEAETERLEALRAYEVLDTLPEQAYDDITYLAAQICETPIALVSLVDEQRQWFKSKLGLEVSETPRNLAFCAHAILEPESLLIVEDASKDKRFADNPLVTSEPAIRFYAGVPLVTSTGHALGTLCVIDRKARQLSDAQQETLRALSRQVIAHLELRRSVAELRQLVRILEGQASVIQRDLQRAEIIQRSLLPQEVPALEDFNLHTLYRPGHTVGGDLYDVVSIADRYLVLVVADASGHGVSAAMLSVLFKQHLRLQDHATGIPDSPGRALARINASLMADNPAPGVFLTAAYCLLDLQERKLQIGSAGHPPILCLRANGELEQISHTGPALGLEADAVFQEHEMLLSGGDKVLLYTDGLLDICNNVPDIETMAAMLRDLGDDHKVLEHFLTKVTRGKMRPDCDDVTIVLLVAAPGVSVFDEPADTLEMLPASRSEKPIITRAATETSVFFVLEGRITWLYGQTLFDAGMAVIEEKLDLVVDLAGCEFLDSTLLGTLHELILKADKAGIEMRLQNVGAQLRENFDELSMQAALEHIVGEPQEIPERRTQIDLDSVQPGSQQQRLLHAHEVLAELSENNREEFGGLVETLRKELKDE